MSRLRTPDDAFPALTDARITLILIPPDKSTEVTFASTIKTKRANLDVARAILEDGGTVVATWTGQYRTDAFEVTPELVAHWIGTAGDVPGIGNAPADE